MEATLRKTSALIEKDFKDLIKNPTMLVCSLMPIGFMLLYSQAGGDLSGEMATAFTNNMLTMALCMTAGMVGSMTVLSGIAEEKEKHTLRTLMLANVSSGQILASRALVAFVTIALVDVACFFVLKAPAASLAPYLGIGLISSIPLVIIALLLGLVARDQMPAGVLALPVILAAFLPSFAAFNETLAKIAAYAPTGGVQKLLELSSAGNLFSTEALQPLVVTLGWIALSVAAFVLLYKRLSRDN